MVDSGPISWQRTLIFRRDSPSCLPRSDIRRILMPAALWIIKLSILLVPTLEFDQDGGILFPHRTIRKTRQPSRAVCGRISDHPLIDQVARVINIESGWNLGRLHLGNLILNCLTTLYLTARTCYHIVPIITVAALALT